jgi:hypothetical protein
VVVDVELKVRSHAKLSQINANIYQSSTTRIASCKGRLLADLSMVELQLESFLSDAVMVEHGASEKDTGRQMCSSCMVPTAGSGGMAYDDYFEAGELVHKGSVAKCHRSC